VVDDAAATCPFVGFWPRVGKAAVVLHAVANRTIDLYSIPLFAAPRIEIPIDGADSPGPDGGYVATGASGRCRQIAPSNIASTNMGENE